MTGGVKGQALNGMTKYSREMVNMPHKLKSQVNVAELSWHLLPGFSSAQHGRSRFPYPLIAAVYSLLQLLFICLLWTSKYPSAATLIKDPPLKISF